MIKILLAAVVVVLISSFVLFEQKNKPIATKEAPVVESSASEKIQADQEATPIVSRVVLDLSGQDLTQTPSYIFDMTDVEELDISNNQLEGSLPAEVRFLQSLKILDLSNNQFTGLPAEIGQLKNLEVLNLSNNELTGLPYELGNLSNLKILNLRGNNYAVADLDMIKQSLPASAVVQVD